MYNEHETEVLGYLNKCIPIFNILADKNRQEIMLLLSREEKGLNVSEINEKMKLSRPAISHHLKILKQAKLIKMREKGTENFYSLTLEDTVSQLKEFVKLIEKI